MSEHDGFAVDVEALYKACTGLRRTYGEMQDNPIRDVGSNVDFGHDRLSNAMAEFRGRWQRGVKNLLVDAEQIDTRLRDSLQEYIAVDESAARALNAIYGKGAEDGSADHAQSGDD